jgi:uncharacterized membrane protein (DUF4010 family)
LALSTATFLVNLAAAIGVGALVGIEREHRRDRTTVVAGVRTFPLVSMAGFLTTLLARQLDSELVLAAGVVAGAGLALGFFYVRYMAGNLGFTTPMAVMVTFLAGGLIAYELLIEAMVVAVATTFLLLTKDRLHQLAEALTRDEMMGALQFVALAFVAFPIATELEGPYLRGLVGDGRPVDLQWTLLIVVAASGLAFVSFLAMRELGGRRGMAASGALGGLVNSEAATASVATIAKNTQGLRQAAAAAVVAAAGTALLRNLVLAGFADPSLAMVGPFALVLVAPLAVTVLGVVWLARGAEDGEPPDDIGLRSPFAIRPALTFALVFTAVNAAAFFLQEGAGTLGVYATSLGAIVSSGAVVASAANLVYTGTVTPTVGVITAVLATVIGFLAKIGVVAFANRGMLREVAPPMLLGALATTGGLVFLL